MKKEELFSNIKTFVKKIVTPQRVLLALGLLFLFAGVIFTYNARAVPRDPNNTPILARVTNMDQERRERHSGKPFYQNIIYVSYKYNEKEYSNVRVHGSPSTAVIGEYLELYLEKESPKQVHYTGQSYLPILLLGPMGLAWLGAALIVRKIQNPSEKPKRNKRKNRTPSLQITGAILAVIGVALFLLILHPVFKDTSSYKKTEATIVDIISYPTVSSESTPNALVAYLDYWYEGTLYENIPFRVIDAEMLSVETVDILVNPSAPYEPFISYTMPYGGNADFIIWGAVTGFIILAGVAFFLTGSFVSEDTFILHLGKIFIIIGILLIVIGVSALLYGKIHPESALFHGGVREETSYRGTLVSGEYSSSTTPMTHEQTISYTFRFCYLLGMVFAVAGSITNKLVNRSASSRKEE